MQKIFWTRSREGKGSLWEDSWGAFLDVVAAPFSEKKRVCRQPRILYSFCMWCRLKRTAKTYSPNS